MSKPPWTSEGDWAYRINTHQRLDCGYSLVLEYRVQRERCAGELVVLRRLNRHERLVEVEERPERKYHVQHGETVRIYWILIYPNGLIVDTREDGVIKLGFWDGHVPVQSHVHSHETALRD